MLSVPADTSHSCVKLGDFISWLPTIGSQPGKALQKQLVGWVQIIADYDGVWEGLNSDLLQLALHSSQGGRARRIPTQLKDAVAREAASGKLARSGQKVLAMMKRMRIRVLTVPFDCRIGNTWTEVPMRKYWGQVQVEMAGVEHQVWDITWDGTRLSGLDFIFSSMYSPSLRKACWNPPWHPVRQS